MKTALRYVLTVAVVGTAIGLVALRYADYLSNPWTRDGQVRANVIAVASRVSGPIIELPVVDNQRVKAGDLLFRIDPRTFQASYDQARANYDSTLDQLSGLDKQVEAARAAVGQSDAQVAQAGTQVRSAEAALTESRKQLARYETLLKDGFTPRANYDAALKNFEVDSASKDRADAALLQARSARTEAQAQLATAIARRGSTGDDNAQLRAVRAALDSARLNLEFTEQRASVNGFVTNLNLRLGSQANANQPALALVDESSFWIDAYFRENVVGSIGPGHSAYITLMSYPHLVLQGRVDSVAWGIARQDGSTAANLLPNVQPSFEWIRLAQRIPIRISFGEVPAEVALRVGTTASVLVRTGERKDGLPPPAPRLLQ